MISQVGCAGRATPARQDGRTYTVRLAPERPVEEEGTTREAMTPSRVRHKTTVILLAILAVGIAAWAIYAYGGGHPVLTHSARQASGAAPTGRDKLQCAPDPHMCGYPDSTNTGVPAGTVLRKVPQQITKGYGWYWDPRGWIVADQPGAVIRDISVNATISVNAPNVTIVDSYIDCVSRCYFDVIIRTAATGAEANANNVVIEDSTITDTTRTSEVGISAEGLRNTRVLRDNISGEGAGILFAGGSGLIEDTYIHDLATCCGFHNEDFQTLSGGDVVLEYNTLFNQNDQTSDIQITQDFGRQESVTVNDNLLAGGGYSIYGGDTGEGYTGPATGIRITDNRLSSLFFGNCGYFGWLTDFNRPLGAGKVLSGNYWDATGTLARLP